MIIYKITTCVLIADFIQCNYKETSRRIIPLSNFRKRVEELPVEKTLEIEENNSNQNLVSFLVNNVKHIFTDTEKPIILLEPNLNTESDENVDLLTIELRSTPVSTIIEYDNITKSEHDTQDQDVIFNRTLKTLNYQEYTNLIYVKPIFNKTKKEFFIQNSKHEIKDAQASNTKNSTILNMSLQEKDNTIPERSCISCNNIVSIECNNPKNKLISSTICTNDEDLCYSQHTPFGIVNRGCFNVYNNVTTYVCSCNLCNYISIFEMPHIFSTKRDWIENVIELSRTRSFRKSIFKDMSCLTCEANATIPKSLTYNTDCFEGNIRSLPIQECSENEICGVKAIRSAGYIWRGCLSSPLYNYWWTFCDSDICNYDSLVSIYDELL